MPDAQPTSERCHVGADGHCGWEKCPQIRDGEPTKSGRSCPLSKEHHEVVSIPARQPFPEQIAIVEYASDGVEDGAVYLRPDEIPELIEALRVYTAPAQSVPACDHPRFDPRLPGRCPDCHIDPRAERSVPDEDVRAVIRAELLRQFRDEAWTGAADTEWAMGMTRDRVHDIIGWAARLLAEREAAAIETDRLARAKEASRRSIADQIERGYRQDR